MSSLLLTGAGPSGAGTAFTPASIPGLAAWYDAAAITGLVDGDPVASWADSSGNGRTATQGTAGNRPTYKTAIQNGRPVVRFDGVDDSLSISAVFGNASGDAFSLFAALRIATVGATLSGRAAGAGWTLRAGSIYAHIGHAPNVSINDPAPPTTEIVGIVRNGLAITPYTNGTVRTGATLGGYSATATGVTHIGAEDQAGGGSPTAQFLSGDIYEALIYSSALSDADRDAVESYLGSKWGITVA